MSDRPPSYRLAAFTHWLNLAFVAGGMLAGALHDPMWFAVTAAVEGGILWVVPDLGPFRMAVDRAAKEDQKEDERAFYLNQLWGLQTARDDRGFFQRLLVAQAEPELDARIVDRNTESYADYIEMRAIVAKLREMVGMPGVQISRTEIDRLEEVITGYLRVLAACRPLRQAISALDERALRRELDQIERAREDAAADVRAALHERAEITRAHLERLPRLVATLQLFESRARSIVHQLRHVQTQVLANPAMDVHGMVNEIVERQALSADPLGALAADQMVQQFVDKVARPAERAKELQKQTAKQRQRT